MTALKRIRMAYGTDAAEEWTGGAEKRRSRGRPEWSSTDAAEDWTGGAEERRSRGGPESPRTDTAED